MEKLHRVNIKANAQQNKCFVGVKDGEIVSAALIQDPAKKKADVEDYVKAGGLSLVYPVGLSKILDFFHFQRMHVQIVTINTHPRGISKFWQWITR